jgi:hypothetical protein
MTDSLRAKLVYICREICPMVLSEDETKVYPYAVYDITSVAQRDKDGIYAFFGETTIRVVSNVKSEADSTAAAIQSAVETAFRDGYSNFVPGDFSKDCQEGIWIIEMNYTLKQYADWSEPVEQSSNTE